MIMKKTTQAYLLLSLVHILLCLSFQIRAIEAIRPLLADPPSQIRNPPPPSPVWPSPPCGSNIGSQVTAIREKSCRQIPRPPKTKEKKTPKPLKTKKNKISRPPAAIP
ncbi:hypothetical protein ARALYDRAFT_315619 [Arabidopsis lyrata subsp. lyrata]|uniref:Transmembrane protein n=1 Tax=Arabidopsis lyrata subsp. lyrata TaxID=81972 RepID=D7KT08_ARALL|nr:uncharacterized protein LOC9323049 [Arabidopsis lyrata subsp. lyrata]EFH64720.1 hypothetical protein ARALYDRAFT_315619 [Arabidopsis lyrata subsp. lyrata]|eukprot:XP_002888461.1 uncharacterized protein LOC9323049 [Arabidopsis lyrata subsp. lyrata]